MAEDGRNDGLVIELIGCAILAGAYSALAQQHPQAEGLAVLWSKWDRRTEAVAGEVAERVVVTRPRSL